MAKRAVKKNNHKKIKSTAEEVLREIVPDREGREVWVYFDPIVHRVPESEWKKFARHVRKASSGQCWLDATWAGEGAVVVMSNSSRVLGKHTGDYCFSAMEFAGEIYDLLTQYIHWPSATKAENILEKTSEDNNTSSQDRSHDDPDSIDDDGFEPDPTADDLDDRDD